MPRRRKLLIQKIASLVVSILVLSALLAGVAYYQRGISFEDSNFEAVIRNKLDNPAGPISRSDLLQITHLDASGQNIVSLKGIEKLTRLVYLDLEDNRVADLSPLQNLSRLTELNLRNNKITCLEEINFAAITGLPLRSLSLRHNVVRPAEGGQVRLTDVSLLGELTSLEELDLRDNYITDISPLSNLDNLRILDLRENRIEDISVLENLTELTELNLRENEIEDISALSALTNLTYLNLHSNHNIQSVMPLKTLTSLETLILRNVPVGDEIVVLKGMTALRRLNLRNCEISDTSVLGDLMAVGALQDDIANSMRAELDIRDNGFFEVLYTKDDIAPIRTYWRNISLREPFDLPSAYIEPPIFSFEGGFYNEPLELTLDTLQEDAIIYYTLDGSTPDPATNSANTYIYNQPILITSRKNEPNAISMINPGYGDWSGPQTNIFKATVVTVIVESNSFYSKPITHTYFIDEDIYSRYKVPVISVTTDPDNFFGYERGIYVRGKIYDDVVPFWRDMNPDALNHYQPANFHQRGRVIIPAGGLKPRRYDFGLIKLPLLEHELELDFSYLRVVPQIVIEGTEHYDGIYYLDPESSPASLIFSASFIQEVFSPDAKILMDWERPVHLEFFESDGTLAFSEDLGVRIHGGASRVRPQKSLRFYARSEYSEFEHIEYRLFCEDDNVLFKRFLLRSMTERSGLDDAVGQLFMREINPKMDIQRFRPTALFINGEFWGLYGLRDRYDQWYLALKYDVPVEDIALLVGRGTVKHGTEDDKELFLYIDNFVRNTDLAATDNYEYVKNYIDLENYLAYMISGIYINYTDWGMGKHHQIWRYRTGNLLENESHIFDGRWRWLPLDLDGAFARGGGPERDYLSEILKGEYWLKYLLENEEFRDLFINRFADAMNSFLNEDEAVEFLMNIVNDLPLNLITEHVDRWNHLDSADEWYKHIDDIAYFLKERPKHMRKHMIEYFNLNGPVHVDLKTDFNEGYLIINSLQITSETSGLKDFNNWSGIYFKDIPITIRAVPNPGYRFARWEGIESDEQELTITLEDDLTLRAVFVEE